MRSMYTTPFYIELWALPFHQSLGIFTTYLAVDASLTGLPVLPGSEYPSCSSCISISMLDSAPRNAPLVQSGTYRTTRSRFRAWSVYGIIGVFYHIEYAYQAHIGIGNTNRAFPICDRRIGSECVIIQVIHILIQSYVSTIVSGTSILGLCLGIGDAESWLGGECCD